MKIKKPKINFQKMASTKAIIAIVTTVAAVSFGYTGFYIYNNIYKTITQTEEIILLKSEVAPFSVNITRFEKILEKLNDKKTSTTSLTFTSTTDPFIFVSNTRQVDTNID